MTGWFFGNVHAGDFFGFMNGKQLFFGIVMLSHCRYRYNKVVSSKVTMTTFL